MIEAKIIVKAESSYMLDLMIGDVMRELSRGRYPKEICYRGKNCISTKNLSTSQAKPAVSRTCATCTCFSGYQPIVDDLDDANPPGDE